MKIRCFNIISLAVIGATLLFLASCDKVLDVQSTRYSSEENHWETVQDGKSGLLGIYSLLRTALSANNAHWIYGELRNGDFSSYRRTDLDKVIQGQLKSTFPVIQDLSNWRRFYAVVNAANVFMEKAPKILENDPLYSADNLRLDINQAKIARAFAYFYMVRIWGDVPLIVYSHDNGSFEAKERTDQDVVLDYISNDILSIINDVPYQYGLSPITYYDQNSARWQGVLFNRISAYALLAHIAAWRGDYVKVEAYTSFILQYGDNIGNNGVSLTTTDNIVSATGLFFRAQPKHLIGFPYNDTYGEYSEEGHLENLTLAAPVTKRPYPDIYIHKDDINTIFNELGDQRHGVDTLTGEVMSRYFQNFNSEIPIFSKVKIFLSTASDGSFDRYASTLVFTRPEEIILLRAEALAVLRRPEDAVTQLNRIRNQRGLLSLRYDGQDMSVVLRAVFEERRKELMGEGWRWYDLVRLNRQLRNNPAFNDLLDRGGIYWPVAETVLQANKAIKQNAYWN